MAALVVETGAGLVNANAYATVAEGDSFAEDHLYASPWVDATSDNKRKALIFATRLLDEQTAWRGYKATDTQALQWPRSGAYDRGGYAIDSNELPGDVKKAAWLLAMALLGEDRTEDPIYGFSSIGVGSIQLGIDKTNEAPIVPKSIALMLAHLGTVRGPESQYGPLRTARR
jgi:hypothetical protein